ncbi:MAG TPA: hypothetical protein VGP43_06815 [Chitinophagaceae bacterium]|nr:hypothetical protein [Chitinophagaceae bacterium]
MKKYILFAFTFLSFSLNAQINKIDHFFVSSPKAEKLFKLFKEELKLPVAWEYKTWGSFSSGAVSLGNVAFEFVSFDSVKTTKFDAIALEARQPTEEFILVLDSRKIAHDTIEYNTYKKKDGSIGGWSTLNLRNLLPEDAGLFICDYKERDMILKATTSDSAELIKQKGGSLGVIALKEIVVGSINPLNNKKELSKLPGVIQGKKEVYNFMQGASIRLIKSNVGSIEKIVIRIHSITAARKYLKLHNLLGRSSDASLYIDPKAIEGLTIELLSK